MKRSDLVQAIKSKKSFLCVGLDTDIDKIPAILKKDTNPILSFNKAVIEATQDLCVAYKPNLAFYESYGSKGLYALEETMNHIPQNIFTIADAKRGDIGNTAEKYAQAYFQEMGFDSVTVAPYMGSDSILPFTKHENKWVILLALTSNKGSQDFQMLKLESGDMLFEEVMRASKNWASPDQLMFVVGATHPEKIGAIRKIAPDNFFLVPGVGAQGGDLEGIAAYGLNKDIGLLINSSRGIIYAGSDKPNFQDHIRSAALELQTKMEEILIKRGLV